MLKSDCELNDSSIPKFQTFNLHRIEISHATKFNATNRSKCLSIDGLQGMEKRKIDFNIFIENFWFVLLDEEECN